MTIETATYISDLNAANPGATDLKAEGDDHLRLLKTTIKATFPNVAGAVSVTHTALNNITAVVTADSSGDVGINNATPDRRLSVYDASSSGITGRFVSMENTNTANKGALEAVSAAATGSAFDAGHWATTAAAWAGRFYSNADRTANASVATTGVPVFLMGVRADGAFIPGTGATLGKSTNRWSGTYSTTGDFSGAVIGATFNGLLASANISQFTNDSGYAVGTSGTYTPTLTNVSNVAASTAYVCQYMKVGSVVTVSGKVDVTPSLTGTSTQLGITLPVASTFTAAQQLGGTAAGDNGATSAQLALMQADATNHRATLAFWSSGTNAKSFWFSFTYQVL